MTQAWCLQNVENVRKGLSHSIKPLIQQQGHLISKTQLNLLQETNQPNPNYQET